MSDPHDVQHFTPTQSPNVSKTDRVVPISGPERNLLCALSYVHLACGQSAHSLALLRLVVHEHSQDVELLRIFAYALISERLGEEALSALDRLDMLDDQPSSRLPLLLLRSHALRQAGRMAEAQATFKRYVSLRGSPAPVKQ
ncbi:MULTISPECIES: histidine kinase [Bradyrhizobium]|uniref:histidine kinase n=1 Tax=Bradyrhizobium TaxID=374 RepID=UPI001484CCB7|nr:MULTISPECIES: histidine kinase [Bradyrhizobium]